MFSSRFIPIIERIIIAVLLIMLLMFACSPSVHAAVPANDPAYPDGLPITVLENGCVRTNVTGYRFIQGSRYRNEVYANTGVAYFDNGIATLCYADPFKDGDYIQVSAYKYDETGTALELSTGWIPAQPEHTVYLPGVSS